MKQQAVRQGCLAISKRSRASVGAMNILKTARGILESDSMLSPSILNRGPRGTEARSCQIWALSALTSLMGPGGKKKENKMRGKLSLRISDRR